MTRRVLIHRRWGGLGDLLVHRPIIKAVAEAYQSPVDLACPIQYFPAVKDHPYISEVLDQSKVSLWDYPLAFDTSTCCARTEVAHLKRNLTVPNRIDIWASQCGVKVEDHSAHHQFTDQETKDAKELLRGWGCVFCPVSACLNKDLSKLKREQIYDAMDRRGYRPLVLHHENLGLPRFPFVSVREWMCIIANAPLVLSVDSAAVHMAGQTDRRLVSLFWVHPGASVTKYYRNTVVQTERANQIKVGDVMRAIDNELKTHR